jgi:hypothetical protein
MLMYIYIYIHKKLIKIFFLIYYHVVQRKSINGTCPGTYACNKYTPLVCFLGLCLWFVILSVFSIFFIHLLFLVQHQQHGLALIAHVLLVRLGLAVHVLLVDNNDESNDIYIHILSHQTSYNDKTFFLFSFVFFFLL